MHLAFTEPPTRDTLTSARKSLELTRASVQDLTTKIDAAEAALAQIVHDSKCEIKELESQRAELEARMQRTLAYLSPIRRLPSELLREIFMWNFADYPCCAWVLAAVCSSWRRLSLNMPRLWSTIRLLTTQHSSADTIRLWLERSGDSVPLDIEIFLRVTNPKPSLESAPNRARRHSTSTTPNSPMPPWALPSWLQHGTVNHYVIPHPPHPPPTGSTVLPPAHTPILVPPSPPNEWPPSVNERQATNSRTSMHWGHIAIFYLVEQMHRWERFIFRFDKQFTSMSALKSINGDAPLLKEFEVSSGEAAFYAEWPWLPNASATSALVLPKLASLTLQYTPFKWSSPMLRANLHTLNLRALPTSHLPLDRILYIVSSNSCLQDLSLHFQAVLPAILPLSSTSLPQLKSLTVGGHYLLAQLVDCLILPSLQSLTFDIESRDAIEDTISNLLTRSNSPPVESLSVAYGSASTASTFYYGPGGIVISWATLLSELTHLRTLHIGGSPFESLLTSLGPPDEDTNQLSSWACPTLESLGMRNCHTHSEGVAKLVQMVEARNPDVHGSTGGTGASVNGVSPARLKLLELYECASLGQDVVKWLKGRIDEVICTEPAYDRSSMSPHPYL